jgi:hypothetical protein
VIDIAYQALAMADEAPPLPTKTFISPKASPTCSVTSFTVTSVDDDLPFNVGSEEQLKLLPEECLSGSKVRPLRHVTEDGQVYNYALQPMFYSVIFILLVELLERFSFYGVNYTQTSFLTGVYNEDWNAGMNSIAASSYVSISTAVGKFLYTVCISLQGKHI